MKTEIEEISQFKDKLNSETSRKRIISVVCDAQDVISMIDQRIGMKLESYDRDVKLEAYQKHFSNWKFWIPILVMIILATISIVVDLIK